jgi:hypothetical protein
MSGEEKIVPITVYDPRTVFQPHVYPVIKGGQLVDYRSTITTNISSSSIGFSIIPTGQDIYVDRKVHVQLPIRLTLTATGVNAVDGGGNPLYLLNPHQCCFRAYPIANSLDSLSITINNTTVTCNPADYSSALTHFNVSQRLQDREFSKCPTLGAQSQDFNDLFGSNRSQMALYSDGYNEENNSVPFTIVSQTNNAVGPGASTAVSVVDIVVSEPLFLSPLLWGKENSSALRGIRNMDIQLNFVGNVANKMIAIMNNPTSGGVAFTPATWNTQVQFNNFSPAFSYADSQPKMLLQYVTPQLSDQASGMNRVLVYPYTQIDRYLTDLPNVAAGAASVASSNQVQLSVIPNRIYVFIRDSNAVMQSSPFIPDAFARIDQMSIQWGVHGTVLSSASQRQLYDLAVENGFCGNFQSWSGEKINKPALASAGFGTAAQQFSGLGSIVALNPSQLGLGELEAPGKLEQFSLQISNVNFRNVSSRTMTPTMFMVVVSSGIFTLYNGQAGQAIGVLNSNMVLNSEKQTGKLMLTFSDVQKRYGGDFFDSLKSGLSSVWSFLKPIVKVAAPALTTAFAPEFTPLVSSLTSGLGKQAAGSKRAGGAKMSKAQLKQRLM